LFSWQKDRNLFFNGPLEFRFNEKMKIGDVGSIQMEKYLIKKYGFFQIPQHDAFKKTLKESMVQKKEESYEFILVFLFLAIIIGILVFYSKYSK
jgi:hypothetical protein